MQKLFLVQAKEVEPSLTPDNQKMKVMLTGNGSGPSAIVSWMEPRTIKAHYHPTDQFQVVLEGGATFPSHDVGPLDAHYSDSRTAYGPFTVHPSGMTCAILRRRKIGIVWMHDPPSFGSKRDKQGREFYGVAEKTRWENMSGGIRRKVTMGATGDGPVFEVIEGKKGSVIDTGPAPYGEYVIFYKGKFRTEGKEVESYALRYAEGKGRTPQIVCESDGAMVLVAKYDRPVLPEDLKLATSLTR